VLDELADKSEAMPGRWLGVPVFRVLADLELVEVPGLAAEGFVVIEEG